MRQPLTPAEVDAERPTLAPCCIPFVDTIDALRGELAMAERSRTRDAARLAEAEARLLAMVNADPQGAEQWACSFCFSRDKHDADCAWLLARAYLVAHDLMED